MTLALRVVLAVILASTAGAQTITTVAGDGTPGFGGKRVNNPYGLSIGPDGALYFCDIDNHAIRKLDLKTHAITTVAGELGQPYELVFDQDGNLYFVDMPKHVVQRIDGKTRAITMVAGTGKPGFSGDGGPAEWAQLRNPHSIALDKKGRLLICDIGNHRVRRVDLRTGIIETWIGTGERKTTPEGAPARGTPVNGPRAIAIDEAGNAYLVLREGNAVYRVDAADERLRLIAGSGQTAYSGDGGPAKQAAFNGPKGIALSSDDRLYVADTENHAIRRIDLATGVVSTVAGTGRRGDGPDGDPLRCRMSRPHGVFVAPDGTIYIGDSEAHRIRALKSK